MRYRSSPSESSDLGLQITIRDRDAPQPSTSESSRRHRGSWASVGVLNALTPSTQSTTSSTSTTHLAVFQSSPNLSPKSLIIKRSTNEFGQLNLDIPFNRGRFESVDSALAYKSRVPKFGGSNSAPRGSTAWLVGGADTIPRRGSLGVLRMPWKASEHAGGQAHWSERRGSWAEGWR
jgi:hypothetical protein